MDEEPKEKIDFEQFINKEVKEKMSIKGLTFMEYLGIPYELIENNEKWEFDFISHDVFYQFLLLEGFGNKTFTFEDISDLYFDYFYYKGDMDFDNKKWKEIIFKFLEANPPLLKQEFDTTDNIIKLKLTDEAYKA